MAPAIAHGYLHKPAAAVARQRLVQVTDAGHLLIAQVHRWQDATLADLTHDWSPAEVQTFTDLMQRLVSAQQGRTARQPAHDD